MRIALPATIDTAAILARDAKATIADLGGETMGTRWHVRLAAAPGIDLDPIGAAIAARLAGLVAEMSQWEPASHLSRFNRAAAGAWVPLPPDFAHVVERGLAIAAASDGAFDPAIGHLVDLAGFGPIPAARAARTDEIAAARAAGGWQRLAFDPGLRRLRQPGGLALDLSGIAKGHAVDVVADLLGAVGFAHVLVEIGGELTGRGVRPDGEPWWVDLETPPGLSLPPLRVALHGLAVATSGDYRRGGHTLDPASGRSIDHGIAAVSVVHRSAMIADAWATALTVAGPDAARVLAVRHDLPARIVLRREDGAEEILSPALAAMLADH